MRAADADRAAVAERLGAAHTEGRLTLADYDERLRDAYAATTYGDLERLTADLPAVVPGTSAAEIADDEQALRKAEWAEWTNEWRSWLGGAIVMFGIWGVVSLATGSFQWPWPVIPVGIWAVILLASLVDGDDRAKRAKKARKKLEKNRKGLEKGR